MAKAPETAAAPPPTETVEALTPIQHDGVVYAVGALITMAPEQAAALVERGAARPAAAAAA